MEHVHNGGSKFRSGPWAAGARLKRVCFISFPQPAAHALALVNRWVAGPGGKSRHRWPLGEPLPAAGHSFSAFGGPHGGQRKRAPHTLGTWHRGRTTLDRGTVQLRGAAKGCGPGGVAAWRRHGVAPRLPQQAARRMWLRGTCDGTASSRSGSTTRNSLVSKSSFVARTCFVTSQYGKLHS